MIDAELLAILACPACRAPVAEKDGKVACEGCGRIYPIRDGIAIMLIEEALGGPSGREAGDSEK